MTVEARGDAASGSMVLVSTMDGTAWRHELGAKRADVSLAGIRVFASFSVRGTFATSVVSFGAVRTDRPRPALPALPARPSTTQSTWQTVTTELDGGYGGESTAFALFHQDGSLTARETVEIDDVVIYSCAPTSLPISGVRGDLDGDRRADAVFYNPHDGRLNSPVAPSYLGGGLDDVTWVGYPGDVNHDGRTDLLMRRTDGRLQLLAGTPTMQFAAPVTIGVGWQGMTALVATGDTTGDGLSDVYARTPSGDLLRYSISADGRFMWGGWRVGTGWNTFTWVGTVGDATGDGRADLVGVTKSGDMLLYPVAGGAPTGVGRRIGTGWFFDDIDNQGDLDGDGHDDLMVVGSGWSRAYRTDGAGGWLGVMTVPVYFTAPPTPGATVPGSEARGPLPGLAPPAGQDCPTGTSRLGTLYTNTFEPGSVQEGNSWRLRTASDAPQGTTVADSAEPLLLSVPVQPVAGRRTYARFWVRGALNHGLALQLGGQTAVIPTTTSLAEMQWRDVTVDLTPGGIGGNSYLKLGLLSPSLGSIAEIDDLRLYQCSTTATGVRSDFDGDGRADHAGTGSSGWLTILPGGTGAPAYPVAAGFGDRVWYGSPGDLTGDRRADLLSQDSAGRLFVHPGDGAGGFGAAIQVGVGWSGMTGLTVIDDVTGDGRQDLYARDGAGYLHLYSFGPGPTLTGGRVVGQGWGIMKHLLQIGDVSGDGRPDLVAIDAAGDMWSYETASGGGFTGRRTRIGDSWIDFSHVSSYGDANGDGHPEILAVSALGAQLYETLGRGAFGETRWTGMVWGKVTL